MNFYFVEGDQTAYFDLQLIDQNTEQPIDVSDATCTLIYANKVTQSTNTILLGLVNDGTDGIVRCTFAESDLAEVGQYHAEINISTIDGAFTWYPIISYSVRSRLNVGDPYIPTDAELLGSFTCGGTATFDGGAIFNGIVVMNGAVTWSGSLLLDADPTVDAQAATKKYVDDAIAAHIAALHP